MKRVLQIIVVVFLFVWPALSWSMSDGITVGVSTGYPPYYFEQNGELVGVCIELIDSVAHSLDLDITYRQYPWKRLLSNAEHGQVDAIMPLFRTKERDNFLYFDNLFLVNEENSFFTWKNREIIFGGNFESLRSYTIGVVSDYSYGEKFDQYEYFKKVTTQNDQHLIKMFKHKRFDIGIGNKDVVIFNANKENISHEIHFLSPYITTAPLYIGFSKKRNLENLAREFAIALQRFKKTDNYQEILKKYGMVQ